MSSSKTFINVGTTTGSLQVTVSNQDIVSDGSFYEGATLINQFSHNQLVNGVNVNVREGNNYQLIVNASFAEDGEASVSATFGSQSKKIVLTGDAEPPGMDFEIAQFHIYA